MLKTVGNPATRYGDQTIVDGNLVIGTAGKGIDFSAAAHAGGMTSELLNDYEEGTFTAGVTGVDGSSPTTPITATGRYTKIGRQVTVQFAFSAVNTSGASGLLAITGLPYASGVQSYGSCFMINNGSAPATLYIQPSSGQIFFLNAVTGSYINISAGVDRYYGGTLTYTV
jgi:hypothetical protein